MLGEPSPVTAIPRRGSPLFVVLVALGGSQLRVRTSLCLVLERPRAVPYPSDGTYGHSVSQPIPWESCLLCGDLHGWCPRLVGQSQELVALASTSK